MPSNSVPSAGWASCRTTSPLPHPWPWRFSPAARVDSRPRRPRTAPGRLRAQTTWLAAQVHLGDPGKGGQRRLQGPCPGAPTRPGSTPLSTAAGLPLQCLADVTDEVIEMFDRCLAEAVRACLCRSPSVALPDSETAQLTNEKVYLFRELAELFPRVDRLFTRHGTGTDGEGTGRRVPTGSGGAP